MTRRSAHPPSRRSSHLRRDELGAGPYSGMDIVRLLERQGFVAGDEGSGGVRVYEHEDGRLVTVQPALPPCVRPGDRVFNLLVHDLDVTPSLLLRLLRRERPDRT